MHRTSASLLLLLPLGACSCADAVTQSRAPSSALEEIDATETWVVDGLSCPAQVVRTEGDVPHIYAENRADVARIYGFTMARHRYFEMDMARRLGQGTITEILGRDGLETDMEARGTGMTAVTDHLLTQLTPDQQAQFDAFAAGVNDFVAGVHAGTLPLPAELEIAGTMLGADDPTTLMSEWTARDVAAVGAVSTYELGYETGDVGRTASLDMLHSMFDGVALEEYRAAGALHDIWAPVAPVRAVSSADGWGLNGDAGDSAAGPPAHIPAPSGLPSVLLQRTATRLAAFEARFGRDWDLGFGSNAWAVTGSSTTTGETLLAGDGHLPLSVPSMFYRVGLDTSVLGGGDLHQLGMGIVGLPILAVGTNGDVAWQQTQLMGDITDWYAEEMQLDDDGLPSATLFEGEWHPLTAETELFVIADVPLLGSDGGTEEITRWVTSDGRWIADVEGRQVAEDEALADGEVRVNMQGDWVVPSDLDGDGVISAISFDYAALDDGNLLRALDNMGMSTNVEEFRQATRGLVAYSQNLIAADAHGSVLYTGYQGVPCRGYLPRDADGAWIDGADPSLLLDGTTYRGFTVPVTDGLVDESYSDDPYQCVVPFDAYPQAIDPARGYVVTANNDPGSITLDDSLLNDPHYIGGPWMQGYRASTISTRLEQEIAAGTADVDAMASIQADYSSPLAIEFADVLLDAISTSRQLSETDGLLTDSEERLAALYRQDPLALDEVEERIEAWLAGGAWAASGVETFYNSPDALDLEDAVATTIFNAWFGPFVGGVFDDEGLPSVWRPTGKGARTRALRRFIDGRGPDNPAGIASWNPDTEESAFFDVRGTDEIETSREVALLELHEALAFLASEPDGDAGGYGTDEMDQWLWGLRHRAKFESVLVDLIGDEFSFLTDQFSITTDRLPLAEDMDRDDPRYDLKWFPRPGDNFTVDAANAGFGGRDFDFGSGPVFRTVIALGPDGVRGQTILPNGQSAMPDSGHFDDQARSWLANETTPMWFAPEDVIANATGREAFSPATPSEDCVYK